MMKSPAFILSLMVAALSAGLTFARETADDEHAELAKALSGAKVSLESALSVAATTGKPISAKYEVEDGKLQLSVYTAKDGKFSEVIVDHSSGKVAESEAITEGEDLAAAGAQAEAMARAKLSLSNAVTKAVAANKGFRAVSAVASVKDGRPVAEISLVKDGEWKTVVEKLD
jgi:hypothetical protein